MSLPPKARSAVRVSDRLAGVLLFLPVPVVLWLFTRQLRGASLLPVGEPEVRELVSARAEAH